MHGRPLVAFGNYTRATIVGHRTAAVAGWASPVRGAHRGAKTQVLRVVAPPDGEGFLELGGVDADPDAVRQLVVVLELDRQQASLGRPQVAQLSVDMVELRRWRL